MAVVGRAPPQGRARWPLTRWADTRVARAIVNRLRAACVRPTRKQTPSHRGRTHRGSFPPQAQADVGCAMEAV
jgi:hypothetical protein